MCFLEVQHSSTEGFTQVGGREKARDGTSDFHSPSFNHVNQFESSAFSSQRFSERSYLLQKSGGHHICFFFSFFVVFQFFSSWVFQGTRFCFPDLEPLSSLGGSPSRPWGRWSGLKYFPVFTFFLFFFRILFFSFFFRFEFLSFFHLFLSIVFSSNLHSFFLSFFSFLLFSVVLTSALWWRFSSFSSGLWDASTLPSWFLGVASVARKISREGVGVGTLRSNSPRNIDVHTRAHSSDSFASQEAAGNTREQQRKDMIRQKCKRSAGNSSPIDM